MIEIPPASPYEFGASLAACGELLLVGSPYRDYAGRVAYGARLPPPAACLYRRISGSWSFVGQVTAADPMLSEGFARSVALAGNSLAVAAPGHENGDGPVHTFDLGLRAGLLLDSPDRPRGLVTDLLAEYGHGLAIDDRRIAVGVPLQGDGGAVYVFDSSGTTVLLGPTEREGFGCALALAGELLVIGADGAYSNAQLAGACYVYRRAPSGMWIEHCRVSGRLPGEELGLVVAADGNRLAVGSPGRVEVYDITEDGCTKRATFDDIRCGALALSGDLLAIGEATFGAHQTGRIGLARFATTSISWRGAPSAKPFARLGSSLALGPDYVAAGMPGRGQADSAGRVLIDQF